MSSRALVIAAVLGLSVAVAIGVVGVVRVGWVLLPFVIVGPVLALAYNLEWFGGRFHNDFWFAFDWGAFPLLTGFFAMEGHLNAAALAGAIFAFALSLAQRILSTQVRDVRRRVVRVSGSVERSDGTMEELTSTSLFTPEERALRVLSVAVVALAAASVMMRVW